MTVLRLALNDVDLADLSEDVDTLLGLPDNVVDLSPSFRRLLVDLDEALLRAASSDGSLASEPVRWVPERVWSGPRSDTPQRALRFRRPGRLSAR